jgi:hypothetical protein
VIDRYARPGMLVLGGVCLILTLGFFFQMPWATQLWPWPDSRLSYIFLASICAAIAAPILWIGWTGHFGSSRGGALNLAVVSGGFALVFLQQLLVQGDSRFLFYALFTVLGLVGIVGIFRWSRRYPLEDGQPTPMLVRISFGIFAVTLILVGGALVARAPYVFPWPLATEDSVLFGTIFLGAACYFAHAVLFPSWANAVGQLFGFLAYDLILIGPFLAHFSAVMFEHRTSLIIYTIVLVYSGLLAIFYLAINPGTRLIARSA